MESKQFVWDWFPVTVVNLAYRLFQSLCPIYAFRERVFQDKLYDSFLIFIKSQSLELIWFSCPAF